MAAANPEQINDRKDDRNQQQKGPLKRGNWGVSRFMPAQK
jgi:hypothetical protein